MSDDTVRMYKDGSGTITCYNTNDIKRAEAKGFTVVVEPEVVVKKTRKKRAKK